MINIMQSLTDFFSNLTAGHSGRFSADVEYLACRARIDALQRENAALRAKLQAAELEVKQRSNEADYWYRKTVELAARQSMKVLTWGKN